MSRYRTLHRVAAVIAPEGLLLLGIAWLDRAFPLADALTAASAYLIVAAFGAAALLASRFRRTRVVLALLALALAYPVLSAPGAAAADGGALRVQVVAVLLPLNLAALALLGDRGAFTPAGLARLFAIVAQAALVLALERTAPAETAAFLARELVPAAYVGWTALSQPAGLASGVALAVLIVAVAFRPDAVRRGLLWATAAAVLAAETAAGGGAPIVYFVGAAILLTVAVVESSYALAYRDGLTGLPTRRAFNEELLRLGARYAIAMVDVDRFKGINDRYGHDVGDQVLRMIATRLARVSGGGKAFRYGGEEFAVVFPGRRLDDVVAHLERVRATVEDAGFTVRAPDRPRRKPKKPKPARGKRTVLKITVSIGAAERTDRLTEPDEVVRAADQALYRAKDGGRNRVVA